jgi:hypothetical protein
MFLSCTRSVKVTHFNIIECQSARPLLIFFAFSPIPIFHEKSLWGHFTGSGQHQTLVIISCLNAGDKIKSCNSYQRIAAERG